MLYFGGVSFYLHLGWTCWTAVLMDCVRWPPAQSHTELDSKQFLQVTQSLSSHRLSQDAARSYTQRQTYRAKDKLNPGQKGQSELKII